MKNVIMLICFLALAYPFSAFGQVKVFNSYSDYANGVFDAYKKTGEAGPSLENYLIVKDDANKRTRILMSSIWGYQDEKGNLHRVRKDMPLKVDFHNDRIVIYFDKKDDTIILGDMIIPGTKTILYFSSDLSSEIYKLNQESLLSVIDFSEQEKERIAALDKKGRLSKKNSDTNVYYLVEALFE
jgi:hypothetical protein